MRKLFRSAVVLAMAGVPLAAAVVATNIQVPYRDTVFANNEFVTLAGSLHVLTQVTQPTDPTIPGYPVQPVPVTVHLNLDGVNGTGMTTGTKYQATGAATVSGTFTMPGAFIVSTPLVRLIPPSPTIPPSPISVAIGANSQGTATSATAPPSGLVRWQKGEFNAGDALGTNPGTLQGTVNFVPGRVGEAFDFTGGGYDFTGGRFVEVASSPTLQPAAVTAMAWVWSQGFPGIHNHVLSQGANQCIAASYALYTEITGLRFYVFGSGGYKESPTATDAQVWDGNWHLAAGTYDGSTLRMYLDGVEIGSGTPSVQTINYALPDNDKFYIGAYRGQCQLGFNGDVDEVMIFGRALSRAEIQSIYNSVK